MREIAIQIADLFCKWDEAAYEYVCGFCGARFPKHEDSCLGKKLKAKFFSDGK